MTRLAAALLVIASIFAALTLLLWRLFRRVRIVKYLPSLLSLVAAMYFFYLAKTTHLEFQDLANALMAVLSFIGFISGLITCIILDYVLPRRKR